MDFNLEGNYVYNIISFESVLCNMKRYSKIDRHLARVFNYNGAGLSSSFSFYAGEQLPPVPNSMISAIRKQGCYFSQLWNPYTLILVLF